MNGPPVPAQKREASTLVSSFGPGTSRPELVAGDELAEGRFAIERVLGRGGMGVVYEALDRQRGHRVALKTLHTSDTALRHAIKREFRALADVHDPALVRLHELFWEDERCFFTMDLLEGQDFLRYVRPQHAVEHVASARVERTLRAATEQAPSSGRARAEPSALDEERLWRALPQLVNAVDALHAAGKLHRDLKPSNVLVDEGGKLTILDFGIALDQDFDPAQTQTLAGTPRYMAPELFAGFLASPESDWYAVGVMLYEALTGRALQRNGPDDETVDLARGAGLRLPLEELPEGPLAEVTRALLRHDPELRPSSSELRAALGLSPPAHASLPARRSRVLVGREAELSQLLEASAAQAACRQPQLVLVEGESGIGKTALLERFAAELRAEHRSLGVAVLFGRCHEREWGPHKAVDEVMEALAQHLAKISERELADLLPDDLSPLLEVFPVLRELPALQRRFVSEGHVNPRQQRRRAYAALSRLLQEFAARQRTVVVIDDLHWGDADSARLLLDLLAHAGAPPCLFVLSYRSGALAESACLQQLFDEQRRLSEFVPTLRLTLAELTPDAAREVAAQWLPQATARKAELLDVIGAEAKGNPLLLRELSSSAGLLGNGPTLDLASIVKARLERLPESARELFEMVCVSGRPLSQAIAARATSGDVTEAVARLQGDRLIRGRASLRPDAIDVCHDRIRQAVLAQLPPEAVRRRHHALALAHEVAGAVEPEVIAQHYRSAGEQGLASEWAERAAVESRAVLALNRAAELYRLAFELCSEPDRRAALRVKLARALSDAGRGGEAAPLFLEAARDLPPSEALGLQRDAAEQFLVSGHTEQGLSALEQVLRAVGLSLPRTPRAALVDLVMTRTKLSLRGLRVDAVRAQDQDPSKLLRADACRAAWALAFVNTIQGAAFQARFLLEALRSGDPGRVALGLGMEAIYRAAEGHKREPDVEALRQAQREVPMTVEEPLVTAFEHLVPGQCSYLLGRWSLAAEELELTEKILVERCRNVTWELNSSRFFWGNSLVHLGRWSELGRRLDAWMLDAVDRGDHYAQASLSLIRTRTLTLAADEPDLAFKQVHAALEAWKSTEFGVQHFLAEVSLVQIALYAGDTARAVSQVDHLWPAFSRSLMQRIQLCRIHMYHHTAYALIADVVARGERRHLKRIARQAERLENENTPWAAAFALYVRAALLDLKGQEAAAVPAYEAAERALTELGMSLYAAACRARRGRRQGGDEGRLLRASASAKFTAQGILRPDGVIAMMAPGWEE
jgi:eukaryotic-like serine/threonine-protein kinase